MVFESACGRSVAAVGDFFRQGPERLGGFGQRREGVDGIGEQSLGFLAGLFFSYDGGISKFACSGVLAGAFSHLLGAGGNIEQVVGDLEGQAEFEAVVT